MNTDRKFIILGTLAILSFVGFLFIDNSRDKFTLPGFWIGLVLGAACGIATSVYLKKTWDPAHLKLKDPRGKTADVRWMPIVVVGGIVAAKLIPGLLPSTWELIIDNTLFIWLVTALGYLSFQTWRYRSS